MNNRLKLHEKLLSLGCPNVYYQIPSNYIIKYPCIKYEKSKWNNKHANNNVYIQHVSYKLTVMSKDPDEPLVDLVSKLPTCKSDHVFVYDNLYHTVFTIYI